MPKLKLGLMYLLLCLCSLAVGEDESGEGSPLASKEADDLSCEDLGDKNSHYICDDKGDVRCLAGWQGPKCDIPVCADGCHPEHGFCNKPGECQCALGWHGDQCNQCSTLPGCQNGFCNSTSFECICEEGWEGVFCTKPTCRDGCHITRGYCERPGECKCRIGWGGPTCDQCKPLPGCIHGNCTKPLECRCDPGWTGLFCQTPVCSATCNQDHGSCSKPGECRCDVGWWGETCDLCFPYPGCKHGTCGNPWECNCDPGWKGMLCDEPDDEAGKCSKNPGACLNGGTCIDVPNTGNFTCSCPSLFTGQRCDYLADITSHRSLGKIEPLEQRDSSSQIQVVRSDSSSLTTSFEADQEGMSDNGSKRIQTELSKDERRVLLQKTARLFFRPSKATTEEEEEPDNSQKVLERKLLPLPVFLPRVSEIIPGEEGPTRILKSVTKEPIPTVGLVSRSDSGNVVFRDSTPQEPESPKKNQISENRRFLRHQQESPDFLPEDEVQTENARGSQSLAQTHSRIVKVNTFGDQPLQISAHASALPRPNPVSPATVRTGPVPRQQSEANSKHVVKLPSIVPASAPRNPTLSITGTTQPESRPQILHAQSRSVWIPSDTIAEDDVIAEGSEDIQTYYEENMNGRVHIGDVLGVDDAAPHDEIYEAFIELKKV